MGTDLETYRAKISGDTITMVAGLIVNISGQPVYLINNGINNVIQISGQTITFTNPSIISNISGQIAYISGQVTNDIGTQVVTVAQQAISSASGGTQLPSQACLYCNIYNLSGNQMMFVGGIGSQAPYSGRGGVIYGGEEKVYRVNNFNAIRICASINSQLVAVDGIA